MNSSNKRKNIYERNIRKDDKSMNREKDSIVETSDVAARISETNLVRDSEKEHKRKTKKANLSKQSLYSPLGLSHLKEAFKEVHFQGEGHEIDDLFLIMRTYQRKLFLCQTRVHKQINLVHPGWAHSLCPSMNFEEFIEKVGKFSGAIRSNNLNGNDKETMNETALSFVG